MRRELHGLNGFNAFERRILDLMRRSDRGRRRPGSGMAQMAEPPNGPRPLAGGAAAALEFDD